MKDIQKKFSGHKVLVLGDCMIDRYIWGKVQRISPEAPVPVLEWQSDESRLGGAANVALNAIQFDADVALCGMIGEDDQGDRLIDLCDKNHIRSEYLHRSSQRPTSVKTRILSGQQHLLRVDQEETHPLEQDEWDGVRTKFDYALKEFKPDILIIQDYNKGLLTPELIEHILTQARDNRIFIAVDPKKDNFAMYKSVDLFKPNLKESRQAIQREFATDRTDLNKAASELNNFLSAKHLMITLSEHGIYYLSENEEGISPTQKRAIVDVCGAGDTVLTVAALALSSGLSLSDTSDLCNIAGGQVCETVGVSTIRPNQLWTEWNGS